MHGGDVYRNKVHTDFSVNVNPLGIPEQVREALTDAVARVQTYPDERCEELREKLAKRYGIKAENVLCGNGASELINAICSWKRPKKALLLAPGFSGYARALRAQGCRITHLYLRKDEEFALSGGMADKLRDAIKSGAYDLFFLANPANPTGKLTDLETMRMLAGICREAGTFLVVDECFIAHLKPEGTSVSSRIAGEQTVFDIKAIAFVYYCTSGRSGIGKEPAVYEPEIRTI